MSKLIQHITPNEFRTVKEIVVKSDFKGYNNPSVKYITHFKYNPENDKGYWKREGGEYVRGFETPLKKSRWSVFGTVEETVDRINREIDGANRFKTDSHDVKDIYEVEMMRGHSYKAPAKKCPVTKMIGNIKGLENSVKRIF